jgi:hypothetical protein
MQLLTHSVCVFILLPCILRYGASLTVGVPGRPEIHPTPVKDDSSKSLDSTEFGIKNGVKDSPL